MFLYVILAAILTLILIFRRQARFLFGILYMFQICLVAACVLKSHAIIHRWWSDHCSWYVNAKYVKLAESKEVNRKAKTMLLLNHTTVADFFIHDRVTDYTCNFLSRYLVAVVFPFFWLVSRKYNTVWFFVRGGRGDNLDKFFEWVDKHWKNKVNNRSNLLVYPEGHRNYEKSKALPLKKGMIRYAYLRKIPVQIAITFGNERLFNEKSMVLASKPSELYYMVDDVIEPNDFKTDSEFYEYVQKRFNEKFDYVYKYRENLEKSN